jgi:outer membrane scaffolding protein for murein synthesis (MipA/OmpV family)
MQTSASRRIALAAAAALIAAASGLRTACAEEKPLWEFGLGVGTIVFRDYRGADTSHAYPLPVPYFVYRGKFLQADRNGVKGKLLDQDRIELNISMNGTTPVRNSSARHGMPDLKPTLEIGPSLDVHVWRSASERLKFDLRMPVRGAFTIQASPRAIGWFFAPHFNVDVTDIGGPRGWNLGVLAGPLFADRRYDAYFYTVASEFATANRPAYRAHGGYSGTQMLGSLSKRYPSFWTGAYVRYDTLAGASYESSPLVKRTGYWSAGVGIAWMIGQSSHLVETED